MRTPPVCPRCGGPVRDNAPRDGSANGPARWSCDVHGDVAPLAVTAPVEDDVELAALAAGADVPVWLLDPVPAGWMLGGFAEAVDPTGAAAVVTAWSGPSPLGGGAELIVVAEEPGVGAGPRFAGLQGLDPGDGAVGRPDAHVRVHDRPVALWQVAGEQGDRAAFAGEADGCWLWVVLWPAGAELLLLEELGLCDARGGLGTPPLGPAPARLLAP